MNVYQAYAATHQPVPFDEVQSFPVRYLGRSRQVGKQTQNLLTISQVSARKLTDDVGMRHHLSAVEGGGEPRLGLAKVMDPY